MKGVSQSKLNQISSKRGVSSIGSAGAAAKDGDVGSSRRKSSAAQIVAIHSFRGGTGKSSLAANVAYHTAQVGKRVALVDASVQAPGIHLLIDPGRSESVCWLENDSCSDETRNGLGFGGVVRDASAYLGIRGRGKLFALPVTGVSGEVSGALHEAVDVNQLIACTRKLISALNLDTLLIDTHAGLNNKALAVMAVSQAMVLVTRPNRQECDSLLVSARLAQSLGINDVSIVVNQTRRAVDLQYIRSYALQRGGISAVSSLPYCDKMANLTANHFYSVCYPDSALGRGYVELANALNGLKIDPNGS